MSNEKLFRAKKRKDDEWFTQYKDVKEELDCYWKFLKDKIVYCNCDDPKKSNFYRYFKDNFKEIGLKGLYASFYDENAYAVFYDGERETKHSFILSNGDFRSEECIAIMRKSDVIVTNPPFSLIREFLSLLIEEGKDFIFLGPTFLVTYNRFIDYFIHRKIFLGKAKNKHIYFKFEDGRKDADMNCFFFNSFETIHPRNFVCLKKYTQEKYDKFFNYDAISIDRLENVPFDYYGVMGVPFTYIKFHNDKQFKILGISNTSDENLLFREYTSHQMNYIINGREKGFGNMRTPYVLDEDADDNFYICDGKKYTAKFKRIFIQRKT